MTYSDSHQQGLMSCHIILLRCKKYLKTFKTLHMVFLYYQSTAQATNQPNQEAASGPTPGGVPQAQGAPQGQPPFIGMPGGFPGNRFCFKVY